MTAEAERRAELRREHRARFVDLAFVVGFGSFVFWLGLEIGRALGPAVTP